MKLMDKFKNLFTDEEIEDDEEIEEPVKIKEVKKEETKKDKLPTFMREKIEKEEKKKKKDDVPDFKIDYESIDNVEDNSHVDSVKTDSFVENSDSGFKFPIEFDENDFTDISRISRQARTSKQRNVTNDVLEKVDIQKPSPKDQVKKEVKVAELYKDKKDDVEVDIRKFRATPIISPIYGVLNKNYHKDEILSRDGNYEINRPSKSLDFDSVRKKAYGGNLEEDIKNNLMCENCDYFKSAKTCKKDLEDDELAYEALCEKESEEDDITLDEAAENYYDYGVEYEKSIDVDSYTKIDDDEDDDVRIVNHEDDLSVDLTKKKKNNDIPPVKSSINLLSTLKKSMNNEEEIVDNNDDDQKENNLELTDDLFNLIDSMYDEGNEE